jgi:hypothetical protein
MAEAVLTLLIIGGLFLGAAALVEGYCWLRDRARARRSADWCGESFGVHRW